MTNRFRKILWAALVLPMTVSAQGWPDDYKGVMLQGFYWDSFSKSQWTKLESMTPELKGYFDLVWVPQSGKCLNARSMGYDPFYFFDQNSSFGTEAELRSMIATFRSNGIGTLADVVVNHHGTYNDWWTFKPETYKGATYQLKTTDIVANDDAGQTPSGATKARQDGVTLSSNNDEGEDWGGMRDLDHKSENVQNIVKAYEKFLKDDLGYTGFRYDMVKGFAASHVGDYNTAAGVDYSVGEYWDGNTGTVQRWIDGTGKRSAAFDFPFRYVVRKAVNGSRADNTVLGSPDWSILGDADGLIKATGYSRYAVTFVENHDTELRQNGDGDPIRRDTLAANAYLLAMPGTPCVFYKHYLAYTNDIKAMIDARKAVGISNTSASQTYQTDKKYYGAITTGDKGRLLVLVGSGWTEPVPSRWTKVASGYHYAYYVSPSTNIVFADKPSGVYDESFRTVLTAVSDKAGAQVVYTLDGTEPTATHGTKVASGTAITVDHDCTLKAALLAGGAVSGTIERSYTFKSAEEETFETPAAGYTYNAYFLAPTSWGTDADVYCWAWIDNGHNYTGENGESWPGDNAHVYRVGKAKDGRYIWQWCYYGTQTVPPAKVIFNNGNGGVGTNQTADMTFTDGGWYEMNSTASQPTLDIDGMKAETTADDAWYTLTGVRMGKPTQRGIYVHQGKKVVIR